VVLRLATVVLRFATLASTWTMLAWRLAMVSLLALILAPFLRTPFLAVLTSRRSEASAR